MLNLFVAFLPLAILGLLLEDPIEAVLFAPIPVAIALIVGGVLILWAEKRQHVERITEVDGPARCVQDRPAVALIRHQPLGGDQWRVGSLTGLSRGTAAEFSFFIAIPTLLAATAYKLWGARDTMSMAESETLLVGGIVDS